MSYYIIVTIFILTSCGQQTSHTPTTKTTESSSNATSNTSPSDSNKSITNSVLKEEDNIFNNGATLAETFNDIGSCSSDNYRQLIYVIETAQFYYCSKTNEWTSIDIRGPKGDAGDTGSQGAIGRDGLAGPAGTPAESIPYTVWKHPVTGIRVFLGRVFTYNSLFATGPKSQLCPTGSRAPNASEYNEIILAGVWNQIGNLMSNDSSSDSKVILEQIDTNGVYTLRLGVPNGSTTIVNINSVTLSKTVYPFCVIDE